MIAITRGLSIACLFAAFAGFAPAEDLGKQKQDAEYLEIREEYTLHEDGGILQRHEHKLLYLTPFAFNRMGETFIVYNPAFQELKVHRAVTTTAEGLEFASTPNALNEILPGFCAEAPPYMHLREMVVTHLGLAAGATAHLIYEIRSKPEFTPFLMGEEVFSDGNPIRRKTVVVRVPKTVELKSRLLNLDDYKPAVSEEGAFRIFTWTLENLPAALPEPMSEPAEETAPRLVFSTCPSWKEAATYLNHLITRSAWLEGDSSKRVSDLRNEAKSPIEFVLSVNRLVVEEVGRASVEPALLGYRALEAKTVFQSNVGCALDKMGLLTAMLRTKAYFAEPVLVSRFRKIAEDVPSWLQFSECRVLSTVRERLDQPLFLENMLYLDPTRMVDGVFEDGLAGRTLFRPSLANNQLQAIPDSSLELNRVKTVLNLTLSKEKKLEGSMTLEVGGSLNPYIRLTGGYQSWAEASFKNLLRDCTVKSIQPLVLREDRSMFTAETDAPGALEEKPDLGLWFFSIPDGPSGLASLHVPVAPESRSRPLRLPRPMREEIEISIRLPEGLEAAALPPEQQLSNEAGAIMSAAWVEEGILHAKRVLVLSKQCIPPEEYTALRNLVIEWTAEDARRIALKNL